ncbi:MAG: hypothetical protein E6I39_08620, partial [Chloroflexi bacterium]
MAVALVLDQQGDHHSLSRSDSDAGVHTLTLILGGLWCFAAPADSLLAQQAVDHIGLGVAAVQAHDLRTGLAHFEAALAVDSTSYEANWRAAIALLDLGDQIPDSVRSPERDSLYARAELLAARAVTADSGAAEGHFALAAAVGKAALHMGKKERIRRARVIRDEALRTLAINPRHDGAYHILGRWNAEIMRLSGFSRFFAKSFLGAGIFKQASWGEAIADMEKAVEL